MKRIIRFIWIRFLRGFVTARAFIKMTVLSVFTGALCGVAGAAFHNCMDFATEVRGENSFLIYFLPLGGVVIVFLYRICGLKNDPGTNIVITAIRTENKIPVRLAPLIFISAFITHLFGGSAGREGAALQIGGGLSAEVGRALKLDERNTTMLVMCGMSGLFSALFGTPVTATVFAMELISVGVFYYTAIVPCFFSAITALFISSLFGVKPSVFSVPVPSLSPANIGLSALIGVCAAVIGMVFCFLLHNVSALLCKKIENDYIRIIAGGALIVLLTQLIGTDYNGAGMNIVSDALSGSVKPEAFALKMLFTVITICSGYKGGEIVPTLFIGSTFGNIFGSLIGLPPQFSAALGMISLFCAVVNCPLSSLLLSVEFFGAGGIVFFTAACAVSYALSGYYGLYKGQKIMYSKLRSKYINHHTK